MREGDWRESARMASDVYPILPKDETDKYGKIDASSGQGAFERATNNMRQRGCEKTI